MPVLVARVGKERIYAEAVESHIGGWFWNAVAGSRIRPASAPEYDYELPDDVRGRLQLHGHRRRPAEGRGRRLDDARGAGPRAPRCPHELVDRELEVLRDAVAELAPVEGRPAQARATSSSSTSSASRARRSATSSSSSAPAGSSRRSSAGSSACPPARRRRSSFEVGDDGADAVRRRDASRRSRRRCCRRSTTSWRKTASEFDTLAELRADIESRLREQLDEEIETEFRAAAVDALVDASNDRRRPRALVEARANELLGEPRPVARAPRRLRRGLSGRVRPDARAGAGARRAPRPSGRSRASSCSRPSPTSSGSRSPTTSSSEFVREQAEAERDEDADAARRAGLADGRARAAPRGPPPAQGARPRSRRGEARSPSSSRAAREKLWTPEKEKPEAATKLWTPGQEENA